MKKRTTTTKKKKPVRITDNKAMAIAMPKAGEQIPPRPVELTEQEQRDLQAYIRAQRALAKTKGPVLDIVMRYGKLAYLNVVLTPQTAKSYVYDAELTAEIEALEEKKKAAREWEDVEVKEGTTFVKFADKKKKAHHSPKGKGGAE